jgi:pyrimidine deaminase RibD-like protein
MPGLKADQLQIKMKISDFRISDHAKLDNLLVRLCEMVVEGQKQDPDLYGVVAAAVLDPNNNCVAALNYRRGDKSVHGERAAIEAYNQRFGDIPEGSIILTTCSPCTEPMPDRVGDSCKDMISASPVHKVYAGYRDPSQATQAGDKTYHLQITRNKKIQALCKAFADTWLDKPLNELQFMGSQCTKDCSGHRAGYAWSKARGGVDANSPYSPSFNKGASLGKQELQRPQPQQQTKQPAQPQQAPNPLRPIKGPTI